MALDRLLTLWPSLTALSSRTGGKTLWAERVTRTNLVAVGEVGAYDVSGLVARESVTMRMRWRSDVTLRSVMTDDDGAVWLIERIGEIGRHRWLDVAVTNFVGVDGVQTLGVWPFVTSPYTAQAGWGLTANSAPVQNVHVARWAVDGDGGGYGEPSFYYAANDRAGYRAAGFFAVNEGFSGSILSLSSASPHDFDWRAVIKPRGLRVQLENGRRGWMHAWLSSASSSYRVNPTDALVPLPPTDVSSGQRGMLQVFFDGSAAAPLRIGTAVRVLSTEEVSG